MTPISVPSSSTLSPQAALPMGGLVVVDGSINELDVLLQQLQGRADVVVLDPQQDVLLQLQSLLRGRQRAFSLHLVGDAGLLSLAGQGEALNILGLLPSGSLLAYAWDGVSLSPTDAASAAPAAPRELVVVDGGLSDLPVLMADLARQALTRTVLVLDPGQDATAQLLGALAADSATYARFT